MIDAVFLTNLVAYSAQLACVAAAGSLLASLVRIDAASVRYTYWRALLALCILLPWLQGRASAPHIADAAPSLTTALAPSSLSVSAVPTAATRNTEIEWLPILGAALVAGMLLRAIWIGVALLRLRRLRSAGRIAPPCAEQDELQWSLGTRAELRYVPDLNQPVTFGAWRPVVLLPESLLEHTPQIQRAVLCHELFHVQRRDWAWLLAEEAVRTVLWFNPAVWWLVSRVQLAREEAVDELTVLATGARRSYIEALVAFADATPLAPAAAFARRRHLFRRVMLISKETVMSARRVVVSCAVMALVVAGGSWFAVDAFPLTQGAASQTVSVTSPGAGPLERRAQPVTPENPVPRRTYSVPVLYPPEAAGTGAGATIMLRITLDESGRVAEARQNPARVMFTTARGGAVGGTVWTHSVSSGGSLSGGVVTSATPGGRSGSAGVRIEAVPAPPSPPPPPGNDALEPFVKSAITAVRQWAYDPPASGPLAFDITLAFRPDADAVLIAQNTLFNVSGQTAALDAGFVPRPPPPPPAPPAPGWTAGTAVLRSEETLRVDGARPGMPGTAAASSPVFVPVPPPPPPPPAPPGQWSPQSGPGAVRVGGAIRVPVKTRHVDPAYPPIALQARVQGVVILEALVDTDGRVADARVLRSIPLLDQAAVEAVRQWEYQPTLLNGQPVPVIMTATVQFTVPEQ